MKKFRYWSRTNKCFIRIYAVFGESKVVVYYEDKEPFYRDYAKLDWDLAIENGEIIADWDE